MTNSYILLSFYYRDFQI